MNKPFSYAKFITGSPEWGYVCPEFRKKFKCEKKLKSATLHISALGTYTAFINGKRVSDAEMAPGWTAYRKRLQYQTYQLTDSIKDTNELTVSLGHGWWASLRCGKSFYEPTPAFIAELNIEYQDGTNEVISTDTDWECGKSNILFSQIYDGEKMDARLSTSFDHTPQIYDYDKGNLVKDQGEPVRVTEEIAAKDIIITPEGDTVIDFGQNLTGTVHFKLNCEAGNTIRITHAEILDKNGNFYTENYRTAKAEIIYITRDGEQEYRAHHTFFGFRYIRVEGWPCKLELSQFKALVMHSDMKRTGYFKCDNPMINKLYSNVIWGQRGNFLDIPTDCPQRDERLGWTGDAQVFARTASINYDTEKFFRKWLRDVMAEQRPDGGVPHVIPNAFYQTESFSTAWGDAAVIIPWELYIAYGNRRLLREHLPMMKKWVGCMYSQPGPKYLWMDGKHFGDWLGLDAPEGSYKGSTNPDLIAGAYYYRCTKIVADACRELGLKSDKYDKMSEKIKKAFLKTFVKRGKLISDTQTAHVVTLHFGLAEGNEELKKALADRLIELIEERGDALSTGFVGTPYLLDTLTEIGRADKAYKLLLREEFPGWLFSVKMGATTIWEHWDGMKEDGSLWSRDMNSFNHYAYGSVASWFYGTILGIKPLSPAYKSFMVEPIPCRELGYAKARIETRSGVITSEWVYEGDTIRYSFTVPEGTVAEVKIGNSTEILPAGSYTRWSIAED